jgi:hypothetical protein
MSLCRQTLTDFRIRRFCFYTSWVHSHSSQIAIFIVAGRLSSTLLALCIFLPSFEAKICRSWVHLPWKIVSYHAGWRRIASLPSMPSIFIRIIAFGHWVSPKGQRWSWAVPLPWSCKDRLWRLASEAAGHVGGTGLGPAAILHFRGLYCEYWDFWCWDWSSSIRNKLCYP